MIRQRESALSPLSLSNAEVNSKLAAWFHWLFIALLAAAFGLRARRTDFGRRSLWMRRSELSQLFSPFAAEGGGIENFVHADDNRLTTSLPSIQILPSPMKILEKNFATAQPRNRATAQPRNRATAQPRNSAESCLSAAAAPAARGEFSIPSGTPLFSSAA